MNFWADRRLSGGIGSASTRKKDSRWELFTFGSGNKSTKSSRSRSGGASQESETRSGRRSGQQNQDRSKKSGRQRLDESGSCSDDDSVKNVTRAKREKNPKKKNEEENREDLSNNNLIVGQEIDKGKPVESDDDSVSVSTSRRNISKKRKPKPVTTSIADNNEEQKNPSNKRKNLRQENVLAESSKDNIENEHKVKKRKKIPSSIKKQRRMIVESESSDSNDDSNTVVVNRRNAGKQQVPNKKKNTKVPIPIPQIDFTTSEESLESPDTEVINNIAADDNASVVVEQPTITINENVLEDSSGDKSDSSSEEEVEGILRLIIEENNEKYRKLRNSELTNNEVIVPDALTKSFASFVSPDHSSGTEEYPGIVVSITSVNESVAVGHMKISPKTVRPVDCLQNGSLIYSIISGSIVIRTAGGSYPKSESRYMYGKDLSKGSCIIVPNNTCYTIENWKNEEALLSFTIFAALGSTISI